MSLLTSPSLAPSRASYSTTSLSMMLKKAGVKQIRKTSQQAQKVRVNNKKVSDNKKKAFKEAKATYAILGIKGEGLLEP